MEEYVLIEKIIKNKQKNDIVFSLINSNNVNEYLETLMDNLTSKVFRTRNASYIIYKHIKYIKS